MSLGSQRFCLRWNNHQSNLLSVFDQLLHDEAFVDVTLAVEGQFLRAHKMVLSACSPYFQTLFVGHPDKHPIVILKDVPYADMRSLLDFMYRGEVSVDQDRLTAFLKVAESLRIKGLTEVNEERCDLPSIASSLLSSAPSAPPPPPHLHRIHHLPPHKRNLPPMAANPLLGSALTAPKRKRGRPRKLSGSGEQLNGNGSNGQDDQDEGSQPNRTDSPVLHNAPELLEVNMGEMQHSPGGAATAGDGSSSAQSQRVKDSPQDGVGDTNSVDDMEDDSKSIDEPATTIKMEPGQQTNQGQPHEPTPSTSMHSGHSDGERYPSDLPMLRLVPRAELMPKLEDKGIVRVSSGEIVTNASAGGVSNNNGNMVSSGNVSVNMSGGGIINRTDGDNDNNNDYTADADGMKVSQGPPNLFGVCFSEPPPNRPQPTRRRIRRRATSSSDPAEQLTEMSVRGLNLFRYASLSEGVYKCMECAKSDILKTFKNKYSFQRHAFLYHEGHQRKVFPCPVCAKEFSRPDKMKNHMKTVHDCFMPKDCVFPAVGYYLPP